MNMNNEQKKKLDHLFIEGVDLTNKITKHKEVYRTYFAEEFNGEKFTIINTIKQYLDWKEEVGYWIYNNKDIANRNAYYLLINDEIPATKEKADYLENFKNFSSLLSKDSRSLLDKIAKNIITILDELKQLTKDVPDSNKIILIEIHKKADNMLVFINNDYEDPVEPRSVTGENSLWEKFYQIAEKGEYPYSEPLKKYFNSRTDNPIYTKGYKIQKLLSKKGDLLMPAFGVEIKILRRAPSNK